MAIMAQPNDPLQANEVGPFGELANRPNPDGFIILPVPAVEDFLPFLKRQLGRDLTPEDIEVHRRKAPSIVVTKTVAEKMQAERAGRVVAVHEDGRVRSPTVKTAYDAMSSEATDRKEAAVDVFGQHLFSLRNQLVERLRRVVESEESRKSLSSLHRKEYDAVAALPLAERDAALALARKAIDGYLQDILMLLTGTGVSLAFGAEHAINYRLVLQVKEVKSEEVVEEFDINRECKKAFYNYYGRWLNRFGDHR